MSLVGSLEDLGLGDLLQIVHLAAKSGVLRLRGESGEGQIVFRKGMIREAHAKGGPTDLRELLTARRAVAGPLLERAWLEAHHLGRRLGDVLVERRLITADAIDALRREQIETAVLTMFGWVSGEFSFEMRELLDDGAELALEPGVNPQFLALEGTRRVDEGVHESADNGAEAGEELTFDEGGEPPPPAAPPTPGVQSAPAPLPAAPAPPAPPPRRTPETSPPVVVIDPSLAVLEWTKAALVAEFPRVHVFQRPSLGIDRIRQYLARADLPLVVVAEDTPSDSATGARDANEIVARLKRQAPAMRVLLMCDEGSSAAAGRRTRADRVVVRPAALQLSDPRAGRERTRIATALAEALASFAAFVPTPSHQPAPDPAPATDPVPALEATALAEEMEPLETEAVADDEPSGVGSDASLDLRETSSRIREGAGRGEVLSQVLGFAAQRFARVALFGVRGERAVGVAQVGLGRAGGPDDSALRELSLGTREPAWFRRVLETRRPLRAAPSDNGDHRLAVLLGNEIPAEAYVAPIVTGDRVAALLYADNLPGGERLGDTGGLEVLLDAAGIALDRALIERSMRRNGS